MLYCNTSVILRMLPHALADISASCPCLQCTVKIIQMGIKTVVYNLAYKVSVTVSALATLDLPHRKG